MTNNAHTPHPNETSFTKWPVIHAARQAVTAYFRATRSDAEIEEAMQTLDECVSYYALEHHLGYARYTAKPNKSDVYRILAREGAQTQVRGIWYPAVVYQNAETGQIYTRIAEEFDAKFRVFDSYQDAFTWGRDF